jgi:hypothetical protein
MHVIHSLPHGFASVHTCRIYRRAASSWRKPWKQHALQLLLKSNGPLVSEGRWQLSVLQHQPLPLKPGGTSKHSSWLRCLYQADFQHTEHNFVSVCCRSSRQLKAGIAAAFDKVHDAAKLKAAVVGLHRSLAAKEAAKPLAAIGGVNVVGDVVVVAAVRTEADR